MEATLAHKLIKCEKLSSIASVVVFRILTKKNLFYLITHYFDYHRYYISYANENCAITFTFIYSGYSTLKDCKLRRLLI